MDLQRSRRDVTAAGTAPAPTNDHVNDNVKDSHNDDRVVETSIPFRLDALPWSGFHTRVVLALGITWILDGLEVTLAGALRPYNLRISTSDLPTAPISRVR